MIPDLTIEPASAVSATLASIVDVQWLGLRCHVSVEPADSSFTVDIRTKPNDAGSSIAPTTKTLASDGKAGLIVADNRLTSTATGLVVLDTAGRVIGKRSTPVGG